MISKTIGFRGLAYFQTNPFIKPSILSAKETDAWPIHLTSLNQLSLKPEFGLCESSARHMIANLNSCMLLSCSDILTWLSLRYAVMTLVSGHTPKRGQETHTNDSRTPRPSSLSTCFGHCTT